MAEKFREHWTVLNGYRKHYFKLNYHFLFDRYNVLKKSSGLEDVGSMQIHLIICLFLAWAIIVLAVIRGVKTLGKVGTKQFFSSVYFIFYNTVFMHLFCLLTNFVSLTVNWLKIKLLCWNHNINFESLRTIWVNTIPKYEFPVKTGLIKWVEIILSVYIQRMHILDIFNFKLMWKSRDVCTDLKLS